LVLHLLDVEEFPGHGVGQQMPALGIQAEDVAFLPDNKIRVERRGIASESNGI